jgi:hypothetical protein
MIDLKEIPDGETWELFARDFLKAIGFVIEEGPDRGPDQGRDMLIVEHHRGHLGRYQFRWLVSCKHNAKSKNSKAVSESDELSIQERLGSLGADGFLGVYSTVASTNLNKRLSALKSKHQIKDYQIFDHKIIENYLVRLGYSSLVMRYFPESYRRLKPRHNIWGAYRPLRCVICDKDLLEMYYKEPHSGLIRMVETKLSEAPQKNRIDAVLWACKLKCNPIIDHRLAQEGHYPGWSDISDLAIPSLYLHRILTIFNLLHSGTEYAPSALEQEKDLLLAMGQIVFRELTEEERENTRETIELLRFGI